LRKYAAKTGCMGGMGRGTKHRQKTLRSFKSNYLFAGKGVNGTTSLVQLVVSRRAIMLSPELQKCLKIGSISNNYHKN
jgi:hypothetical protein